jgi:hypothetical protein
MTASIHIDQYIAILHLRKRLKSDLRLPAPISKPANVIAQFALKTRPKITIQHGLIVRLKVIEQPHIFSLSLHTRSRLMHGSTRKGCANQLFDLWFAHFFSKKKPTLH